MTDVLVQTLALCAVEIGCLHLDNEAHGGIGVILLVVSATQHNMTCYTRLKHHFTADKLYQFKNDYCPRYYSKSYWILAGTLSVPLIMTSSTFSL